MSKNVRKNGAYYTWRHWNAMKYVWMSIIVHQHTLESGEVLYAHVMDESTAERGKVSKGEVIIHWFKFTLDESVPFNKLWWTCLEVCSNLLWAARRKNDIISVSSTHQTHTSQKIWETSFSALRFLLHLSAMGRTLKILLIIWLINSRYRFSTSFRF